MHRAIFCLKAHHPHLGKSTPTTTLPLSTTLQRSSLLTFFSDETRCPAPTSMIFFRSGHQLFLRIRNPLLQVRMRCITPSITLILEVQLGSASLSSTMVRSKKMTQPRGSINPSRFGIVILGLSEASAVAIHLANPSRVSASNAAWSAFFKKVAIVSTILDTVGSEKEMLVFSKMS